jgi:hypothetical protein
LGPAMRPPDVTRPPTSPRRRSDIVRHWLGTQAPRGERAAQSACAVLGAAHPLSRATEAVARDLFGGGPGDNDGLSWAHCDGAEASEAVALAWRPPLAVVSSSLARWPTTQAARGCRIGLMQRSASLPGLCSLQPLVLGCAVSDWHVPLTVFGIGAVRSRWDGSGLFGATVAAAFWSA